MNPTNLRRPLLPWIALFGVAGLALGTMLLSGTRGGAVMVVAPSAVQDLGLVEPAVTARCEWTIRSLGGEPVKIEHVQSSCGCIVPTVRTAMESGAWITRVGARLSVAPGELIHARLVAALGDPEDRGLVLEALAEGRTPLTARVEPATVVLQSDLPAHSPPTVTVYAVGEDLPTPTATEEFLDGGSVRLRRLGDWESTGRVRRQREYRLQYEVVDESRCGDEGVRNASAVLRISAADGRATSVVVRVCRSQSATGPSPLSSYLGSVRVGDVRTARWVLPRRATESRLPAQIDGSGVLSISAATAGGRAVWVISATVRSDREGPFVARWRVRDPGEANPTTATGVMELTAAGVSIR